jgi:hypothetical protein
LANLIKPHQVSIPIILENEEAKEKEPRMNVLMEKQSFFKGKNNNSISQSVYDNDLAYNESLLCNNQTELISYANPLFIRENSNEASSNFRPTAPIATPKPSASSASVAVNEPQNSPKQYFSSQIKQSKEYGPTITSKSADSTIQGLRKLFY